MNNNIETKQIAAQEYAVARRRFLRVCGTPDSCRDPLTEFAEVLVADLLDATKADSRVEKGFDLIKSDGRRVQVKSLSNPNEAKWRNEITMKFDELVDDFALVIYEDLRIKTVLVFPKETLIQICEKLGKKHGRTDSELQFTRSNFHRILNASEEFRLLGLQIINPV